MDQQPVHAREGVTGDSGAWDQKEEKIMKKLSVNTARVSRPPRRDPQGSAFCNGFVNKLFKSCKTSYYDRHVASLVIKRDDRVYPEPPSRSYWRSG